MTNKGKNNFGFFDNFEVAPKTKEKEVEEVVEDNFKDGTETAEDVNDDIQEVEEETPSEEQEEEIVDEPTDPPVETPEGNTEDEEKFTFQPLIEDLENEGILKGIEGKEYTDDEDGLRQRFKDSIEAEKQAWLNEIPEDYKHLVDFLKAGKPVEDFIKTSARPDYEKADLEDETTQKSLITEHLTSLGYKENYIKKKLETYESLNELKDEAEVAKEFLVEKTTKEREAELAQVAEQAKQYERQAQENIENLEKIIYDTKEIAGFKLTKKEQKEFRDYLLEPDKKTGKTKAQLNDSPERRLKLAYLDFIDFNKDDVDKKATTKVSKNLQKVVSRYTNKNAKASSAQPVREARESVKVPDIFGIGRQQIVIED